MVFELKGEKSPFPNVEVCQIDWIIGYLPTFMEYY
jgi:hypothetical protein